MRLSVITDPDVDGYTTPYVYTTTHADVDVYTRTDGYSYEYATAYMYTTTHADVDVSADADVYAN